MQNSKGDQRTLKLLVDYPVILQTDQKLHAHFKTVVGPGDTEGLASLLFIDVFFIIFLCKIDENL